MPNTKQNGLTTEEPPAPYDVSSDSMYLPVHDKATALDTIFKDTNVKHGLTMFVRHELAALDLWQRGPRFYLHCLARRKKVLAKPEEVIRQLCLKRILDMDYTLEQLNVEVPIKMGSTVHSKAADIVIYRETSRLTPYIVIELKRPQRRDGLDQLETYMNATGVPFGWWLNGTD